MVSINSQERDGLRQAEFCPCYIMDNRPNETLIPDRSQPGLTMTASTASHWGVGHKCATGGTKVKKIKGRENISIGTWNVRTLRPAVKLEEMDRYHLNIPGLCAMRWKNLCEMSSDDRHKVYFSRDEDRRGCGVDFLVHKDMVSAASVTDQSPAD